MNKLHMGPAHCALDIGDGSERAEYVDQDYILHRLGRPHRAVNIMYTYYPHDAEWPARISEAWKDRNVTFAWDYPYDDYFPYDVDGQPFAQMRDIRRHGQEVLLTLTVDCGLTDDELRGIARQLRSFGRMMLRINHECCGDWFQHNKRYTYAQVGAFFVRFAGILRAEAPNVRTIFCGGWGLPDGHVEQEEAFRDCYAAADLWSCDCYPALHYGWPYDVAEVGGGRYKVDPIDALVEQFVRTYKRATELAGESKPMITAEFNTDGDVTGPLAQGDSVVRFARWWRDNRVDWFRSISLYQFRDRGRLGLECEDPNNKSVGVEQPLLSAYRDRLLYDPWFMPEMTEGEAAAFPAELRWGSSEDADGLAIPIAFEGNPVFCEMTVEQDIGLMAELNGRWFYKAPGTRTVDMMSAFFDRPLDGPATLTLRVFAPPADGVNVDDGSGDWMTNYRAVLAAPPAMRIRYQAPGVVG
uniref:GH26 domain-containing protein n=1 Tax=uncultured bacterium Ad_125_D08 TaxID=1489285 RepID=A0A0B4N033_9BACT|nr:putative uncharacterized protein [uncultured bacterium Ad_125_D08]